MHIMSQSKRNIFSFDSKFSDLLIRFTGIVTVNFLWLLCCLPIVTAGAATKAMYASLDIVARLEDGAAKGFFFSFRKQFWTTTSLWMLILFVGIGLVVDFMILANWEFFGRIGMYVVLFLVSFLLLVFCGMLFPMLSRFSCGLKEAVKNAFLLGLAYLPRMVLVTTLNLLPVLMLIFATDLFLYTGGIWLICGFGLIAYRNLNLLEPVFAPYKKIAE